MATGLPARARLPFAVSLSGRFGYAGHGLAVLLFLDRSTGSLAVAGTLSATFAFTATGTVPLRARLMDRRGTGAVLPALGLLYAAAVAALLALGPRVPPPVLAVPLLVMGISAPPMGVVMRILWAALVPRELLARALGRDAVAEELSMVCGPLLGGLAASALSPGWAVALTGALVACAAVALGRVAHWHLRPSGRTENRAPARFGAVLRRLAPVLLVLATLGALLGTLDLAAVAVPGVAALPGGAGGLLALLSAGSAAGAVVQGRLPEPAAPLRRAVRLTALVACGTGALVAAPSPLWWAAGMTVLGTCVAPAMVAGYLWVSRAAGEAAAEANAWANTALGAGGALGSAAGGALVTAYGPGRACALTGGSLLVALVVALPAGTCPLGLFARGLFARWPVKPGVMSNRLARDAQRSGPVARDQGEASRR